MRIVITNRLGLAVDAEIDVASRKVESLMLDDSCMEPALIGLAVLSGCVEAILKEEFDARTGATSPGSMRRATTSTTTNRPDVPVCEGGCE